MNLSWNKCQNDVWCDLSTVNLQHAHFQNMKGVYIIWHGGKSPATVRVGQGNIAERLAAHRQDKQVQAYAVHTLYVTWASVPAASHDGVEAFLADRLNPLVGERFPEVVPITVNLPW